MYEEIETERLCGICEEVQPIENFHRCGRGKRLKRCKSCRAATRTDYKVIPPMDFRLENIESTDILRFLALIELDPDTNCWLWTGALNGAGYSSFWHRGNRIAGHRWSVAAAQIPFDIEVDQIHHRCGVKRCTNPKHLEVMPRGEHQRYHAQLRREKKSEARERLDQNGRHRTSRKSYGKKVRGR